MINAVRENSFSVLKHMNVQPERFHSVNEKSMSSEHWGAERGRKCLDICSRRAQYKGGVRPVTFVQSNWDYFIKKRVLSILFQPKVVLARGAETENMANLFLRGKDKNIRFRFCWHLLMHLKKELWVHLLIQ